MRDRIIEIARADARIVSAAEMGSLTQSTGDRFSDLDLTFGLAGGVALRDVMQDWTAQLAREFRAVHLFDLPFAESMYRVYLLPGNLQVDLSWTPRAIAQRGPKFRMLFGDAVEQFEPTPADPDGIFGLAVHHALHTRVGVERRKPWSAAYFLNELRNETLSLTCARRGLPAKYARGFDDLPADVLDHARGTFAASTEPKELLRALGAGIELLLHEGAEFVARAPHLEEDLRALVAREL